MHFIFFLALIFSLEVQISICLTICLSIRIYFTTYSEYGLKLESYQTAKTTFVSNTRVILTKNYLEFCDFCKLFIKIAK